MLSKCQPVKLPAPHHRIALFASPVKAGFASPAETYAEKRLDPVELLIRNPAATYLLQVSGQSMRDAGILHGDYVVVDRSLVPAMGDIVVAEIGGGFTLKFLDREGGRPCLRPANPEFPTIHCAAGEELAVVGVVRAVIRNLKP
jgi:DNA polymerase V